MNKHKKKYDKPQLEGKKVFTMPNPHSCCKSPRGASQPCNRPEKLGSPVAFS